MQHNDNINRYIYNYKLIYFIIMLNLILESEQNENVLDGAFEKHDKSLNDIISKIKSLISDDMSVFIFLIKPELAGQLDDLKKECYDILDDIHANYSILSDKKEQVEIDIDEKYDEMKMKVFLISNVLSYFIDMNDVVLGDSIPSDLVKKLFENK